MCVNKLPRLHSTVGQLGFEPMTEHMIACPASYLYATEPHTQPIGQKEK